MQLDAERRAAQEKLQLLGEARESLTHQFKSLANDILEEKGKRFAEQNQQSLGQLLDPLRARLQEFQGKVELFSTPKASSVPPCRSRCTSSWA